jgi:1,2-phenylacetyl-CoA epoxidase PaaB subunit
MARSDYMNIPRASQGIQDGFQGQASTIRRQAIGSMVRQEGQYQLARARRVYQRRQPPKSIQQLESGVAKVRRKAIFEMSKDELKYQAGRFRNAMAEAIRTSGPRSYLNGVEITPSTRLAPGARMAPPPRRSRNRSEAARKAAITRRSRGR